MMSTSFTFIVAHMIVLPSSYLFCSCLLPIQITHNRLIDQLRVSPDRWSVGLKLFFEGSNEVTRFFGLSLVRDFMSTTCKQTSAFSSSDPQLNQIYNSIRDALWTWTTGHVAQNAAIPTFILNNVVTVLTLLIKRDFPERWPSAFRDVLAVGSSTTAGESNLLLCPSL